MKSSVSIWISLAISFLCLIGVLYFSSSQKYRIGYVDASKLLNEYHAMKHARKEFERKEQVWKNNIDSLTNEIQVLVSDYNFNISSGKSGRDIKVRISEKQKDLQNYQIAISKAASDEEARLTRDVLKTINVYIEEYGKKKKYDLIHVATNGNIAYANTSLDITGEIIDALNYSYTGNQ